MNIRALLVTVGGLGRLPAPGTFGSLPPLAAAFLVPADLILPVLATMCAVGSIITLALAPWYSAHFGANDPSQVVSDEVAGMALTLLIMVAAGAPSPSPAWIVIGFLLFRGLDIVKPWPINPLQRLRGGWGVLADDLAAGGLAAGVALAISAMLG